MRVEIAGVQGLDRLGDLAVEQAPARAHESRIDGGADPLVDEIEAARHLVQDLPADELFHPRGGGRLVARGRAQEEIELELAADDGPDRGQIARRLAQAVEPPGGHLPHVLGEWQLGLAPRARCPAGESASSR